MVSTWAGRPIARVTHTTPWPVAAVSDGHDYLLLEHKVESPPLRLRLHHPTAPPGSVSTAFELRNKWRFCRHSSYLRHGWHSVAIRCLATGKFGASPGQGARCHGSWPQLEAMGTKTATNCRWRSASRPESSSALSSLTSCCCGHFDFPIACCVTIKGGKWVLCFVAIINWRHLQ